MKVAVIGGGISGMGAALALSEVHDVQLFEQADRMGGHANTVNVVHNGRTVPVDTGFIVYNNRNYPNLTGLFEHLDVPTKWSDMSFGLSVQGGRMEYACDNLDQLFAQRINLLRPSFLRGIREILRFNRTAPGLLASGALEGMSLAEFIRAEGYSDWFRDCFVLAMGGAIWSTPPAQMMAFPAASFVAFFRNHDLMNGLAPMQRWRTVEGGSRTYVTRLTEALGPRVHTGTPAVSIRRTGGLPVVTFSDGSDAVFDQVILACHGPQAYALLSDRDPQETEILSTFRTSPNVAVLHSDASLMPKRRKVWSSWNFLSNGDPSQDMRPAPVTYWMHRLQGTPPEVPLFVSLNPPRTIDPDLIHGTYAYDHPVLDAAAFRAQEDIGAIQGRGGIWYAGAWLGYGFHEDGLRSGLRAAAALGAQPTWAKDMPKPAASFFSAAAE
ncbi:MAG: FAD-dependent oxidoreductase [Pseudomonadota bacterium]